jgi:radical SAM protein with 4Fe4S-binding SPASM domain
MKGNKMERWLEITTIRGCQNLCDYCPQVVFSRRYQGQARLLTMEVFQECINKVPKDVGIHFSGYSEPWLNPDCTEMLLYAFAHGHQLSVYTTLVGMKTIDVDRIRHVPFSTFLVHLPDADRLMKVDPDDDYLALLRYVDTSELSGLTYRTIGRQHPRITECIGPKPEEPIEGDFVHSRAGNVDSAVKPAPAPLSGRIRCSKNRTTKNVLLPNGDVTLCCMDYGLRHVLGNLIKDDYEALHWSDEYRKVLSSFASNDIDSLCRRCEWAKPA